MELLWLCFLPTRYLPWLMPTEEILLVLVAAGSIALSYSIPIAATIMLLLGIAIVN
jgi:hypothetical protein